MSSKSLSVLALTGGHNAPSGYARLHAYVPSLKGLGVDVRECPCRAGLYPPSRKWQRPPWAAWNLADRAVAALRSYGYELTFLQRELFSTFVTLEPLLKRPRVFDVDDAVWMHPRGRFARRIAELSDYVICGNRFLAEEFSCWNSRVSVIPTPVETRRFYPPSHDVYPMPIIGWLGLSCGFKYLYQIEPALRHVLEQHRQIRLRIVSDRRPCFQILPPEQVEFIPYRREREVANIQEMTVGIMPLDDSVTARGKCSFKMLLYMACGVPVVVTPVGMNADVLKRGAVGLGPRSNVEWVDCLNLLLQEPDLRTRMGKAARQIAVEHYSVEALSPLLACTLIAAANS
jgi:glycosyltransferase involved in cell wall biosynthesis